MCMSKKNKTDTGRIETCNSQEIVTTSIQKKNEKKSNGFVVPSQTKYNNLYEAAAYQEIEK